MAIGNAEKNAAATNGEPHTDEVALTVLSFGA
jgi:hypothetical protein